MAFLWLLFPRPAAQRGGWMECIDSYICIVQHKSCIVQPIKDHLSLCADAGPMCCAARILTGEAVRGMMRAWAGVTGRVTGRDGRGYLLAREALADANRLSNAVVVFGHRSQRAGHPRARSLFFRSLFSVTPTLFSSLFLSHHARRRPPYPPPPTPRRPQWHSRLEWLSHLHQHHPQLLLQH